MTGLLFLVYTYEYKLSGHESFTCHCDNCDNRLYR